MFWWCKECERAIHCHFTPNRGYLDVARYKRQGRCDDYELRQAQEPSPPAAEIWEPQPMEQLTLF